MNAEHRFDVVSTLEIAQHSFVTADCTSISHSFAEFLFEALFCQVYLDALAAGTPRAVKHVKHELYPMAALKRQLTIGMPLVWTLRLVAEVADMSKRDKVTV